MRKLIRTALMTFIAAVMCLIVFSETSARAEAGKYYILISVEDLSSDGAYDSCNNSKGYIMIKTRKQNGETGQTLYAKVKAGEWDQKNSTIWYWVGEDNNSNRAFTGAVTRNTTAYDGFPTEIRFVKDNTNENSTNWMTNDNGTYTSKEKFTVWVAGAPDTNGNTPEKAHYHEVQSWTETTMANGHSWSDQKVIEQSKYPVCSYCSEITGPDSIRVPEWEEAFYLDYSFSATPYDQYDSEWHGRLEYGIRDRIKGKMSFTDRYSGILRVEASDKEYVREPPGDFTTEVYVSAGIHELKSKSILVLLPRLWVYWYNDGAVFSKKQVVLGTIVNHPTRIPERAPNASQHYVFTGWGSGVDNIEEPVVVEAQYHSNYRGENHTLETNDSCTRKTCSVCGYETGATLSDGLDGQGTQNEPWQITGADDWNLVCRHVAAGGDLSGKYIRLNTDLTVGTVILGEGEKPFTGNFNGNGHTITLTMDSTGECRAPFGFIRNATIRNVKTTGENRGGNHCSGLIGKAEGTNLIENCDVGAAVQCTGTHCGGILGHGTTSGTTIRGCVFRGSISGATHAGTIWGWSDSGANPVIEYCLDLSSSIFSIGLGDSANGETVTNVYYACETKQAGSARIWTNRGKMIRTLSAEEGISFGAAAGTYDVSGITRYGTLLAYNGYYYAGEGDVIVIPGAGITGGILRASAGGEEIPLYRYDWGYLLEMPGADVMVSLEVPEMAIKGLSTTEPLTVYMLPADYDGELCFISANEGSAYIENYADVQAAAGDTIHWYAAQISEGEQVSVIAAESPAGPQECWLWEQSTPSEPSEVQMRLTATCGNFTDSVDFTIRYVAVDPAEYEGAWIGPAEVKVQTGEQFIVSYGMPAADPDPDTAAPYLSMSRECFSGDDSILSWNWSGDYPVFSVSRPGNYTMGMAITYRNISFVKTIRVDVTNADGVIPAENYTAATGDMLLLPGELNEIGDEAFMNTAEEIVCIPYGCEKIGARAFAGATHLKEILIPTTVTKIDGTAFDGCGAVYVICITDEVRDYATAHGLIPVQ